MRALLRSLGVLLFALVAGGALLAGPLRGTDVNRTPVPRGAVGQATARIMPSVVDIQAQGGGVERGRIALGTGVVVERGGLIVTNDHVVTGESTQPAATIEIILHDGRHLPATLVGRVPDLDLALLRVTAASSLPPARFAPANDALVGQAVVAIGAPELLPRTVSAGRVTAIRESMRIPGRPGLTTVLETSACLRPGYSGGPTVDSRGRVVGISFAGTPGAGPGCRGYAIPSETVLSVVRSLAPGESAAGAGPPDHRRLPAPAFSPAASLITR